MLLIVQMLSKILVVARSDGRSSVQIVLRLDRVGQQARRYVQLIGRQGRRRRRRRGRQGVQRSLLVNIIMVQVVIGRVLTMMVVMQAAVGKLMVL